MTIVSAKKTEKGVKVKFPETKLPPIQRIIEVNKDYGLDKLVSEYQTQRWNYFCSDQGLEEYSI